MKKKMKGSMFVTVCCISLLFMMSGVIAQSAEDGTITGKITTSSGETMAGGWVYLFDVKGSSPFTAGYWRHRDYSIPIGDDGRFSRKVPEGTYYLMAVQKSGEKRSGTPEEGDLVYPPMDGTESEKYVIRSNETTDIGTIAEAVPFMKEWARTGKTGIEGVVLDVNGEPAVGKLVLAFRTAAMDGPAYVSDSRTDMAGKYILRLPEGGHYYVRVRGNRESVTEVDVTTGEFTKGPDIRLTESRGSKTN